MNPSWANNRWAHRGKRDETKVPDAVTYRCVTEVYRLTPRLLQAVVNFSLSRRGAMFCEMRAPSICAMQPWCRMRSLFDPEHIHILYSHRRVPGLAAALRNGAAPPTGRGDPLQGWPRQGPVLAGSSTRPSSTNAV